MTTTHHNKTRIITKTLSAIIASALLTGTAVAYGATPNPDGSITVENGDTLSAIAQQFGGTYHDYTGYKSGDPNLIYPGETVTRTKTQQTVDDATLNDLADRVLTGEFGNNPERHDNLAKQVGEQGANAVQELVNHKLAGNTGIPTTVRGMVSTTIEYTEPATPNAATLPHHATTTTPQANTTTTPTTVNKPKPGAKRVWVVDVAGHYEMITVDEDVYETKTIPAVTQQVLVKDAWDETITVPATYKDVITILEPEREIEVEVEPARTETIHHDAEYKTIPAKTHEEQVEDTPAHWETRIVKDAWDEQVVDVPEHMEQVLVTPEHEETRVITPEHTEKRLVTPEQTIQHPAVTHEEPVYEWQAVTVYRYPDGYVVSGRAPTEDEDFEHGDPGITTEWQQVQTGTKTVVDKAAWTETIPAVYEDVTIPAVTETVTVPAVYDTVTVPATYKTVHHDAITEQVYVDATYKTVVVVDEPERQELVSDAWDETVHIPAKTEKRIIPAVTRTDKVIDVPEHEETVHHKAEYKTVVLAPETTHTYKIGTRKVTKQGKWIPEQGHWANA